MRPRVVLLVLLAAAVALLAAPQAASAITCTHPSSAYSKGAGDVEAFDGPSTGDPLAKAQWGLTQIAAPGAWSRGARGKGVTIAVVDTGVDLAHPDLRGKLLSGADFATGGENNHCAGPQDEHGHGTHVAGIAAAATGNGIGVAGTAPSARILPVRVLDPDGAEPQVGTVTRGIRWAADHGADVINLSLGGLPVISEFDGTAEESMKAVDYAWARGAVVVAAAGNESFPLCSEPSSARNAVCVGATDPSGLPSYYSNFPVTPNGNVGVRAPGGEGSPIFCEYSPDIWSTVWPEELIDSSCGEIKGYETFSGTSMAAPYVSGVAALLAGRGLSNGQIVECLRRTSSNDGEYDPVYGWGIVDAAAAVQGCGGSTPSFDADGGPQVKVSVKSSRSESASSGRVRARVRVDRPVTVKLKAVLVKGDNKKTGGRASVKFKKGGKKSATVQLSESARRSLRKSSSWRLELRWYAGSARGRTAAR